MPAFFISSSTIHGDLVTMTGDLCHHLRASLRVQIGQTVWLTDERRNRYHARVTEMTHTDLTAHIQDRLRGPDETSPRILLAQALLKGEHMDWIVQKATELGVYGIVPLITHRGVVRPQATRISGQVSRWQRIALEAAQQSEQWHIPDIEPPCGSRQFFMEKVAPLKLMLVERAEGESFRTLPLDSDPQDTIVVAIGPEGGWSRDELTVAGEQGFRSTTLGPGILRSETASLAALTMLQSRLGKLG
ncbi:MAG: 16S rRNA (uracil(1498)-N(3))-methyltransferase [Nitrospiraceae bacterium]